MTYDTEMSCETLVELVTDYLDGTLDPCTEQRFRSHLARCEGCAAYLDQMRTTLRLLGSVPPESITAAARDRLLAAFRGWTHLD